MSEATGKKWFHERNNRFLDDESINVYFEDILRMSNDEFEAWLRRTIDKLIECWDVYDTPPVVGINESEMIAQFNKMSGFNSDLLWDVDELTNERNVIRNKFYYGNAVNQFFPTMYKAPIKKSMKKDGESIYDALKTNFAAFLRSAHRNFKRDSFYHYSQSIIVGDKKRDVTEQPLTDDPVEWIKEFELKYRQKDEFDYWLNPIKNKEYSGYNQKLFDTKYLWLTKTNLASFMFSSDPTICFNPAIDAIPLEDFNPDTNWDQLYEIRFYKKRQRLFPLGMKCFRIAYGKQIAVNFPPLIAKALYERYTDHLDKSSTINVFDPSAGWAGRILGAMAIKDDRHVHYIGTDPNTDHTTGEGRTKYHEVADFFNNRTTRSNKFFTHQNTYHIFQLGSEVIKDDPEFQQYRGTIDLVFTSPPYFAKEIYSDDPTQSCHKFGSSYDAWRDGFLKPTLETAVEWLRNDRYLLWNVADPEFDGVRLPLEEDSRRILESLGMEYVGVVKMALAQMPGANRLQESDEYDIVEHNTLDGVVREKEKVFTMFTKNSCKLNGRMTKYEPILVFRKP